MSESKYCPTASRGGRIGLTLVIGTIISTVSFLSLTSISPFMLMVSAQDGNQLIDIASANETSDTSSEDQQDSPPGSDFTWNGMVSSRLSILPGHENIQSAVVLPPREDGAMYSGMVTFHANRPVDVISWNVLDPINVTVSEDFGNRDNVLSMGGLDLALTELDSSIDSGSIPFTGNALELVGDEDPFLVTYSVNAIADNAVQLNDVRNLSEITDDDDEDQED
jgi:hypothetical protein